jgi:hypothetical protein
MIYTIARTNRVTLVKDRGGFVWETIAEAEAYLDRMFSHSDRMHYSVYGADADWEADTVKVLAEHYGHTFRALRESARMIRLESWLMPESILQQLPNGGAVVAIIAVVVIFLRRQDTSDARVEAIVKLFTDEIAASRREYVEHLREITGRQSRQKGAWGMADDARITYDEWGHIESKVFPDGSIGGVLERYGPNNEILCGRLNYARNGDPSKGYDRLWWYHTVDEALHALRTWDYPNPPVGFFRDLHKEPISILESGRDYVGDQQGWRLMRELLHRLSGVGSAPLRRQGSPRIDGSA